MLTEILGLTTGAALGGVKEMIAWLLGLLPARFSGRLRPQARRDVKKWMKGNPTVRTLRYGLLQRLLFRGTDHPILFALLVGAACWGLGWLVTHGWSFWRIHIPALTVQKELDVAAFTAAPWGIQATLAALVYPIVFAFIALMLQRRAHSSVALRVYVLESGIVPAGASAFGLLLAIGAQFFVIPYVPKDSLVPTYGVKFATDGIWLGVNLALAGYFLTRTIRFIQEEDQRHAYTRVAVHLALKTELTASLQQHKLVGAPQELWGVPDDKASADSRPKAQMFSFGRKGSHVRIELRGNFVLHDVHLNLLRLVFLSWSKRAIRWQKTSGADDAPLICFPAMAGRTASGSEALCIVEVGPTLNVLERWLLRSAFWYRPARRAPLALSTKKMLEEVGAEVASAADQRHFEVAEEGLRNMVKLHKALLQSCVSREGEEADSIAVLATSPYSWGGQTFDVEWIKPYREIGRIAVEHVDEDLRLFKTVAAVPYSLALELPLNPERLLVDAMMVGTNLSYHLSNWWIRRADASHVPGVSVFKGELPAPLNKTYEQAVIQLVGGWSQFQLWLPKDEQPAGARWAAAAARALVYAKHIEHSASLFLSAVGRGDDVASVWLLDNFLKWWGTRQHELNYGYPDEYRVRHVSIKLASKSWAEVREYLWDGNAPVTINEAVDAMSLGIRRFWEGIRLYLVLQLIQNAGSSPEADSRELRLAAALIEGKAQKPGGEVQAFDMNGIDDVASSTFGLVFGIDSSIGRIDGFAETLQWDKQAPEVSGWMYGWSGGPSTVESMKRAQVALLAAVARPRPTQLSETKKLLIPWWKDLDKLTQVSSYRRASRYLSLQSCSFWLSISASNFGRHDRASLWVERHSGDWRPVPGVA
jgi:uncharacterized PurR-regulated membrane protein YhhQ (DUF165 family)